MAMATKLEEEAVVGAARSSLSPPSSALRSLSAKYSGKIPVHLVDKHAYVWRVEDVSRLRSQWHICGLFSGTLPQIPQQNVFLGLPLQLFEEEVVFLIRSKAIILISDPVSFDPATESEYEQYQQAYESDIAEQARKHEEASQRGKGARIEKLLNQAAKSAAASAAGGSDAGGSISGSGDASSIIPAGKDEGKPQENLLQKALERRLQREEKRRLARLQQSSDEQHDDSQQDPADESSLSLFSPDLSSAVFGTESAEPSAPASPRKGKGKATPGSLDSSYMHITAGSALEPHFPMEWYHPDNEHSRELALGEGKDPALARIRVHDTLSSAKRAGDWHYPETKKERAKCAVFEDLQKRGYYMGKGLRFGGDFVVYPGDPLRYHSHFTATVRESPKAPLPLMELIANGRLGTAVKKAHCISSASGVREGADLNQEEALQEEDDVERIFGTVEHFSLTWGGFGT